MKIVTSLALTAAAALLFTAASPRAEAQVAVGVNIGPAPVCPYGYYDYAPYSCAPYGYYGPEWFVSGVFVGAGPWYRGPAHFRGHVDNRFDVRGGYHGPVPNHGEHPVAHPGGAFHGNEMRDGRGHVVR
jgi:hypothetical protein